MEQLKTFLIAKGFEFEENFCGWYTFTKELEGILFYYLLTEVAKEEGLNYKYMFSASPMRTFDRWVNAEYQRYYKDEKDFVLNWNLYLIPDYGLVK